MTEQQRYDALYNSLIQDGKLIHVGLLLQRAARKWPDNTIVICQEDSITYQELYIRSLIMADRLRRMGLKPQDRVIIFYENSIEFYIAYFAVWQAGGVVAPLNVFLHEAELTHIIHDATPALVIISPHLLAKLDTYPKDTLPPIITDIDRTCSIPSVAPEFTIPDRDLDQMAALLYTSGTTGFPKGVMLSSRNIIINTIQGIARLKVKAKDKVYCALPLFHSLPQNTCVWANTVLGTTAIIMPKIDRTNLLNGLKHQPALIVGIPALFGLFSLMKTIDFTGVRYFSSGGDALSDKIRALFGLLYRRKICNGYGLTESSPFISVDIDDYTQPTSCVGKPFIGMTTSIRDENNQELPQGSVGVLWIKGDNIMLGYYNAPQATQAVLQNGWLNTGDLAYIDKNGKIILSGRQRDLIINKGVKIYPQEVENILLSHSGVLQAAVVGLQQHDEEIPVAFIATREKDTQLLIEQLKRLCERSLAIYKNPRRYIIKRELPLTATGKVDKKALRAELI
jgi:long-chain acyl-CoA synthetase